MEYMVFGISKIEDCYGTGCYLVWSAPAPQDETEPEYVKPLAIRLTLKTAQHVLHNLENVYTAGRRSAEEQYTPESTESDDAWDDHVRSIPGHMD